ncbi:4Fe-4S ferredoxin [Methanobacterium alcaliphilum]|uniref:4Fe-4S ferredoxin n=1 Tax=Methanobacterium alcaliphilum TaxID=392018 RepID=UPI00200AD698|nr:4Fe-4S ferredoxin [Methanobacterium alcaliphilum]MCK9151955.1 4Fe-4S ferredoxin [Methanobacterium alcaliphilum]
MSEISTPQLMKNIMSDQIIVNIQLDEDKCQGSKCGICACICPTNVFTVESDKICIKSPDYCKFCFKCMEICPNAALSITR